MLGNGMSSAHPTEVRRRDTRRLTSTEVALGKCIAESYPDENLAIGPTCVGGKLSDLSQFEQ